MTDPVPAITQMTPTREMKVGDADRERFELLYAAYFDRVLAYTLCRVSVDGARDATAETFLVAWRRLGDVPDDPLPWLIGVARRCVADQRRSMGRRDALAVRLRQIAENSTARNDDPADAAAERDLMVAAMRRLSPFDRELLLLVAWDGLSSAQAAQSLGCTRAAFAVRLHRARRRLVVAFDAEEANDGNVVPATRPRATFQRAPIPNSARSDDDPARITALSVSGLLSTRTEETS